MKIQLIILFAFFCSYSTLLFGQCTSCYNMTEALLDPLQVKTLNLNAEGLRELPKDLEKFSNLETLILSNNKLTELKLDFGSLTKLNHLDLSNNPGLSVFSLPESFYTMPLSYLNLSQNSLDALPGNLGKFSQLQHLDASHNSIQALPVELSFCKKLNTLLLADNQLSPAPCMFCDYWALQKLDIGENKLLNLKAVFQSLLFKDQLRSLRVTNLLDGEIPAETLSQLPLEELEITGSILQSFDGTLKKMEQLKTITFESCQLTNPAKLFRQLNQIKSLENIVFKKTDASKYLTEVKNLKKMVVQEARLEDPKSLESMPALEQVELFATTNTEPIVGSKIQTANSILPMDESMINNQVEPLSERPAQVFLVPADTPCEIKLENSTFSVPKNAFLTANGEVYNGRAKLLIKEHLDPIVMALEGAPMVIKENNTNELFSSNGMIEFSAVDNKNQPLKPNPEAIIQVSIADQQPNQNSSLFLYDSVQRNWNRLASPPRPTNWDSIRKRILDSLNLLDDSRFVSMNIVRLPIKLQIGKQGKDPHLVRFVCNSFIDLMPRNSKLPNYYFERGEDARFIMKQEWRMDQEFSEEWKNFRVRTKKDTFYYKKRRMSQSMPNQPRPIQSLLLSADKSADHFTLDFEYKGERKQIPIYLAVSGRPEKIQRAHAVFYKKYQRLQRKEKQRFEKALKRFKDMEKDLARQERERLALLLSGPNNNSASKEQLKFGLTSFGLVNCDFFSRNVPDEYLSLTDFAQDENGDKVRVPKEVRNVLINDNTYVVTEKDRVPLYVKKAGVVFFIISATEIAVVRSYEQLSRKVRPIVQRISIKGLSSSEIRDKILGL